MAGRRVTVLERGASVAVVSPAMVHAMIDYAERQGYTPRDGALAIRGRATEDDQRFQHVGRPVHVVRCQSALAVREALLAWNAAEWLVIITDRDRDDLGDGILAHFVGQTLRSPDPWQAVRQRFSASAIDAQLVSQPGHRDIAFGLLEILPADAWPPAPAGVLTRRHAFSAVARSRLGLPEGATDLTTVLGWSTRPDATAQLVELREVGGDALADAVIDWMGSVAGEAKEIVSGLLRRGHPGDLVPLGLVIAQLRAVEGRRQAVELALARLSHRWSGASEAAVRTLGAQADTVVATLLTDGRRRPDAERVIVQADALVREAQAKDLAGLSPVLTAGLRRRFEMLADALSRLPHGRLAEIERAWQDLRQHALSETDPRTRAFESAVRLARWLAPDAQQDVGDDLASLAHRQLSSDGWVDAAVNDAAAGAGDDHLGQALGHVLGEVAKVRDAHDRQFAQVVAKTASSLFDPLDSDGARILPLEQVLPRVVLPLARQTPVLLLVLDGLSTSATVDVMDDLINRSGARWVERLLPGARRRSGGIAVLPSITDVSRTSLLAGKLMRGQQADETKAYQEITDSEGLTGSPIFHKKELDSITPGFSLAGPVRSAIDDTDIRLVTCVLNTIDDALDRSDPAGTHWHVSSVKHLGPILERAREAGRTVVITSDHGHVVERRQGYTRSAGGGLGAARYRPVGGDVADDEILVTGSRVLTPDHSAVLAVSERLRYGPLKAGYHGGAAPAEVVVPVIALVPVEMSRSEDVPLAPPQEPSWWSESTPLGTPSAEPQPADLVPSLFDVTEEQPTTAGLGQVIIKSPVYREQRKLAGRITLADAAIAGLIDRLSVAPQGRLSQADVAKALDLAPPRVLGAFEQLRKVLNVEGYAVVRRDLSTGTVILDEALAREQFGVSE